MFISLKDHRLNQLQDCALIMLYHLEDIAEYLSGRVSKHQQCNIYLRLKPCGNGNLETCY